MSTEPSLFRKCFPSDLIVRELGPDEIAQRGFRMNYWEQYQKAFPVWSPLTGDFEIPQGFFSDGASIPDWLWGLISDTAPYILFPSGGHDLLFSLRGVLPNGKTLTRQECNECIAYWMRACGAAEWRVWLVSLGLAIGSKRYWDASKPAAKVESAKK